MNVKRKWHGYDGKEHEHSDESLVAEYLTGYVDYYSGGSIEHMERKLDNLIANTAELLVKLHGKAVVDLCEDK